MTVLLTEQSWDEAFILFSRMKRVTWLLMCMEIDEPLKINAEDHMLSRHSISTILRESHVVEHDERESGETRHSVQPAG